MRFSALPCSTSSTDSSLKIVEDSDPIESFHPRRRPSGFDRDCPRRRGEAAPPYEDLIVPLSTTSASRRITEAPDPIYAPSPL